MGGNSTTPPGANVSVPARLPAIPVALPRDAKSARARALSVVRASGDRIGAFHTCSAMSGPAVGRRLVVQQECANKLMRGHWVHDGRTPAHLDEAWSWRTDEADGAIAGETARCTLLSPEQARRRLKGKWLLIVGDSVARFIFAALLALANGTDPALGWPTHRVHAGLCMAHPVANGTSPGFGIYHPGCQLRWRGSCYDDARGQGGDMACTLDYHVAALGARLTFQWHTFNRPANLAELTSRLRGLRQGTASGSRSPDLTFVSTGHWVCCSCDSESDSNPTLTWQTHSSQRAQLRGVPLGRRTSCSQSHPRALPAQAMCSGRTAARACTTASGASTRHSARATTLVERSSTDSSRAPSVPTGRCAQQGGVGGPCRRLEGTSARIGTADGGCRMLPPARTVVRRPPSRAPRALCTSMFSS